MAKKKSLKHFTTFNEFQGLNQIFIERHLVLVIDKKSEIRCCGTTSNGDGIYFSVSTIPKDLEQLFYGCCWEDSNDDDFSDIYSTTVSNFCRIVESLVQFGRLCYFKC